MSTTDNTSFISNLGESSFEIPKERRHNLISKMVFPSSYVENTEKEELILKMVECFRCQYTLLFPHTRKPLLLSLHNECSCRKFISTFIRPTELMYEEFYDAHNIAEYISNYVRYEALDDPENLPSQLNSPTTVMEWQIGNCIEMSILLASLLIGAGYNAYVTIGYAVSSVCSNDTSIIKWPESLLEEVNPDDVSEPDETPSTKYIEFLKERPKLVSQYEINKEKEEQAEPLQETQGNSAKNKASINGENSDKQKMLIHAWVTILPNKRQVEIPVNTMEQKLHLNGPVMFKGVPSTTIFHESELHKKPNRSHTYIKEPVIIEPASGRMKLVKEVGDSYLGVESMFNHQNYYVNLKPEINIAHLSFEIHDLGLWERIFIEDATLLGIEEVSASASQERQKALLDATADTGANGDQIMQLPTSWVAPITLSPIQHAKRYPGGKKIVRYSDSTVEMFADYFQPDMSVLIVKTLNANSNRDEKHIFYKYREDKLRRRSEFSPKGSKEPSLVHQWFFPGRLFENSHRVEGLRELIEEIGIQRTMRFYWKSRDDGLTMRTERFFECPTAKTPKKIKEFYKGRKDFLIYRSASFDPPTEAVDGGSVGLGLEEREGEMISSIDPMKMSEKYARNMAVPAEVDIMKKTYVLPGSSSGEIWVKFHYVSDSITHGVRLFPKSYDRDRDTNVTGLMPVARNDTSNLPQLASYLGEEKPEIILVAGQSCPRETDALNQLREYITDETNCLNEIRVKVAECKGILSLLLRTLRENPSTISIYDTVHCRARESADDDNRCSDEERRSLEVANDYLAPFIAKQDNMTKICKGEYSKVKLTPDMAKKVREDCVADLKESLIERGQIMQARLDNLREELMNTQMTFQKSIESSEAATRDAEKFAKYSKETTWRIRIMEERLSSYIKASADRYKALAEKLASDPRLAMLYTGQK